MASVGLTNVRKSYGALQVVHDISLSVDDGEFIALVGPSGCGKSTLLRMIAGLEDISEGEITIGGIVVNAMTPRERNIAMVFQSYALYPHMTVGENMGFNLKLAGVTKPDIATRVGEAARMLALEDLLDRKPSQLSGGQRQRVALAELLVGDGQHRHVTAESLYAAAQTGGQSVSLATVYNTLKAFCEAGLIQEITVDGSKSYFDTNMHDHPHFFWEDSGKLTDAPADQLEITRLPDLPEGAELAEIFNQGLKKIDVAAIMARHFHHQ